MTIQAFRKKVFAHYASHGRHTLPWRKTHDPYKILVSEVMLQQTQVERVIPFYIAWMKAFPTAKALADAPLSKVLRIWQGLGYNRRAKNLHNAAKALTKFRAFPEDPTVLPGVGPYTAGAINAFVHNKDAVFIETNIRTVFTHHFFPRKKKVPDSALIPLLEKALPKGRAREWYSALMDYGSFLKRSGVRINTRSTSYTKQKTFKGSAREARGAVLKALMSGPQSKTHLMKLLGGTRTAQLTTQLAALLKEGMIEEKRGNYSLPA